MRVALVKPFPNLSHDQTIISWFHNHNPDYPHNVTAICGKNVNKMALDPYDAHLIIFYIVQEDLLKVIGFMPYDSDDILLNVPEETVQTNKKLKLMYDFKIPWKIDENFEVNIREIYHRIDWIFSSRDNIDYKENGNIFRILLLISAHFPEFRTVFLKKEKEIFDKLIEPFLEADRFIPQLFDKDNYPELIIKATLEDHKEYYQKFPNDLQPPRNWYKVHLTEVTPEIIQYKILYVGGFVHIHRKEIGEWIWRRLTKYVKLPAKNGQLDIILSYIQSYIKPFRNGKNKRVFDIEDLAPCISKMIKTNKFPKDQDRMNLVRTLRKIEAPLSFVEEIMEKLNNSDPTPYSSAKQRWDYVQHYNVGYKAPWCESMGNACAMCPGTIDKRKMECHQKFKEKFPEKYKDSQARFFRGPFSWSEFLK